MNWITIGDLLSDATEHSKSSHHLLVTKGKKKQTLANAGESAEHNQHFIIILHYLLHFVIVTGH